MSIEKEVKRAVTLLSISQRRRFKSHRGYVQQLKIGQPVSHWNFTKCLPGSPLQTHNLWYTTTVHKLLADGVPSYMLVTWTIGTLIHTIYMSIFICV